MVLVLLILLVGMRGNFQEPDSALGAGEGGVSGVSNQSRRDKRVLDAPMKTMESGVLRGGSFPAVVNGAAVRAALEQAAVRRIDIVGLGDSNQPFGGAGWDHGVQDKMSSLYPMYATGLTTHNENGGFGNGVGYKFRAMTNVMWADWTLGANTGAPAFFDAFGGGVGFEDTHGYCWGEALTAVVPNAANGIAMDGDCPVGVSGHLRGHVSYGQFATVGDGMFQPQFRLGAPPGTVLATGVVNSEGYAVDAMAEYGLDLPADGLRSGPLQFWISRGDLVADHWRGRVFTEFVRVENVDRAAGFSYHTWAWHGGKSARFTANALITANDSYKRYYLQQVRRLQGGNPIVIFWINHGFNDRGEPLPSVGPQAGIVPGWSAAAYGDNLQGIINSITEAWTGSGGATTEIYFVLMPSHPVENPNDPRLESYRAAAAQVALANPRTCAVDLSQLTTADEMAARFEYDSLGVNHLAQHGYERLACLAIDAIMGVTVDLCANDCNGNGVPDDVEVAGGTALDCNGNGIPDECDALTMDCNGNGIPDSCDLLTGVSGDCNGNGTPDECEGDCNGNGVMDACECFADCAPAGGNGLVNIDDLVSVLNGFGAVGQAGMGCDVTPFCGNGVVNIDDLVAVLNAFGVCP